MLRPVRPGPSLVTDRREAVDRAYQQACAIIDTEGFGDEFRMSVVAEIFDLVDWGETDPHWLCTQSISKVLARQTTSDRRLAP